MFIHLYVAVFGFAGQTQMGESRLWNDKQCIEDLNWPTLQKRRYESGLSMFYKFLCQESTLAEVLS